MKKAFIILACLYSLLCAKTNASKQDSLFFFSLLPKTSEYLLQDILNVDTLKKISPVDTVLNGFFGFTAGQMKDTRIRWFFKPGVPPESSFVAFVPQKSMTCSYAIRMLGQAQT